MSRIGKKPVSIPAGVTVTVTGSKVVTKGVQGELAIDVPAPIRVTVVAGLVNVVNDGDAESRSASSLHGLVRSLVFNNVEGVSKGYKKELEIQGVGFKAALQGKKLVLSLGFSTPKEYELPDGLKCAVDGAGVNIVLTSADKQLVGNVAALLRSYFPAEPYKGKGVRYKGEHVRRKVGKTVA